LGVADRDGLGRLAPAMYSAHQPETARREGLPLQRYPVGVFSCWRLLPASAGSLPRVRAVAVDVRIETGAIVCFRYETCALEFYLLHNAGVGELLRKKYRFADRQPVLPFSTHPRPGEDEG